VAHTCCVRARLMGAQLSKIEVEQPLYGCYQLQNHYEKAHFRES
jgi:hypothetical protein